jgi:hypothetical protein
MNQQNLIPPPSTLESQFAMNGISQASLEITAVPASSDRLYQVAALAAGIVFLATLI